MNRRTFLSTTGGLALGSSLSLARDSLTPSTKARRSLRVAHLTDVHISGIQGAEPGFGKALRHAQDQTDAPGLILFGGDCIGDALDQPKDSVLTQWDRWDRVLSKELRTPHRMCLGNHDIWGWKRSDSLALEQDPDFGKALGLKRLGLSTPYYSFDEGGWHFIVLDSMQRAQGTAQGYAALLDDRQFDWLSKDLKATPADRPICVLSHIPLFSAAALLDGDLTGTGNYIVPGAWVHLDFRRIKDLFKTHPNVKVCLSGHLHMVEDLRYLGVRYLCNGAVCGGWWNGSHQEFGPSYTLLDFFEDGTVEPQQVAYL